MPREVHEHWAVDPDDPENRDKHFLTGYTVITRESPWDDATRARALELVEYEDSLCGCGCGLPRDVAHKKQGFMVHDFRCWAGKAIDLKRRLDRKEHENDDGWFDGRHYAAVPATPAKEHTD